MQRERNLGFMVLVLFLASTFLLYIEGYTTILGLPLSYILIITTIIVFLYFMFSHRKNRRLN